MYIDLILLLLLLSVALQSHKGLRLLNTINNIKIFLASMDTNGAFARCSHGSRNAIYLVLSRRWELF